MSSLVKERTAPECLCSELRMLGDLLPFAVWIISDSGDLDFANRAARAVPSHLTDLLLKSRRTAEAMVLSDGDRSYEAVTLRSRGWSIVILTTRHTASVTLLRELYGLTPAEGRVVSLLASGFTTSRAAAHLGLSLHTVRSHIKSAFAKTGSRNQNDLVARLNSGLASLQIESATITQLSDSKNRARR